MVAAKCAMPVTCPDIYSPVMVTHAEKGILSDFLFRLFIPLLLSVTCLLVPSLSFAWTPIGPWGGDIHDLKNHSAGSNTLYAATGNGLYVFDGSLPWTVYSQTQGYRILEVSLDPARGLLFAITRSSREPFDFGQSSVDYPPPGNLYSLNLASGTFSHLGPGLGLALDEVTAIAVTGSGTLLVGTVSGDLRRFNASLTEVPSATDIGAFGPYIRDILGSPGDPVSYLAKERGLWRSPDEGATWTGQTVLGSGVKGMSLGRRANGDILLGTDNGQVFAGSSNSWPVAMTSLGTGLPPYPVINFGTGPNNEQFATLRDHNWWNTIPAGLPPGLFQLDISGTWRRWETGQVTTRVGNAVAAFGDLFIAYDQSGIYRLPGGEESSLPGTNSSEGIAAVSLNGIAVDPRVAGRCLVYGDSGLYEGIFNDSVSSWTWNHVTFDDVVDPSGSVPDYSTWQMIREAGILSTVLSHGRPGSIWVGGDGTGLLVGNPVPPGSVNYRWANVYNDIGGRGQIWDIFPDPFNSSCVWWSSTMGIYLTDDNFTTGPSCLTEGVSSIPIHVGDIDFELVEPNERRNYLAGRINTDPGIGEPGLLTSEDGISWYTSLYTDLPVRSVALNPDSTGAEARAIVGPSYDHSPVGLALVKNSVWTADTTVDAPGPGTFSNGPDFMSMRFPLGNDGDGIQDAYAVVWSGNTEVYHSSGEVTGGSPGQTWERISDLNDYLPISLSVDPKDGNLLYVATRAGSAYTHKVSNFQDNIEPGFSLYPDATPGKVLGGIGSTATSVYLGWLAPGDDGDLPGWADRYELRCSESIFSPAGSFSTWGTEVTIGAPLLAHLEEYTEVDLSISGWSQAACGLRAFDEGNLSSVIGTTGILMPMARIPLGSPQAQASGSRMTVSWDTSTLAGDPYFGNYGQIRIERTFQGNTALVASLDPSTVSWEDAGTDVGGFQPGDSVSYSIIAQDGAGNGALASVSATFPTGSTGGGGGGGGGGCFIATAAYGTYMEPEVQILRDYRDRYLKHRTWGRALIRVYETFSPGLAHMITEREWLRSVTRGLLTPIILSARAVKGYRTFETLPVVLGFILVIIPMLPWILFRWWRKRSCVTVLGKGSIN